MFVPSLMGIRKLATSAYHATSNGDTERANHTMAQMMSTVISKRQDNWDKQLLHVEFAYKTLSAQLPVPTGIVLSVSDNSPRFTRRMKVLYLTLVRSALRRVSS